METVDPKKSKPSKFNNYLKYSNLAFQLFGGVGLAAWLGYTLDKRLGYNFPAFLLTFTFLVFGGMMYQVYRSLNKE